MNPEVKALWTTALRSGEYEQCHDILAEGGQFCCLGVLCDLAVKAGVPIKVSDYGDDLGLSYDGSDTELPESVSKWAGLDDSNPEVTYAGEETTLAGLNDGISWPDGDRKPLTFKQIANVIDRRL